MEGGFEKQTINHMDLYFIMDIDDSDVNDIKEEPFFDPASPIEANVTKLLDDYSPVNIVQTMDLFHEKAADKIWAKYKTFGIDK